MQSGSYVWIDIFKKILHLEVAGFSSGIPCYILTLYFAVFILHVICMYFLLTWVVLAILMFNIF